MPSSPGVSAGERAGILLALVAVLFTVASFGWLVVTAGVDAPEPLQEGPLRQVLLAGLVSIAVAAPLVRRRAPSTWRPVLVRLVPAMTAVGVLGHAIATLVNGLEPATAIVAPDYGHVLHPDQPGGTLWLFLIWGAPLAGLAAPAVRSWEMNVKLGSAWVGFYYAGVGLWALGSRVVEAGGGRGASALFGLVFASLVVGTVALVLAWIERRGHEIHR